MTHHTDAERAEFEAVASDNGQWPQAIERDAKGDYLLMTTAHGWMWWQAARRAPAAPQAVPSFTPLAQRKLDDLLASGFSVTGYSIERASPAWPLHQRGFVTHGGMVGWWTPHAADGLISPVAQADARDAAQAKQGGAA